MQIEMRRNGVPDDLRLRGRMMLVEQKVARLTATTHREATLFQGRNPGLGETNIVYKRGRKMRFPVVFELIIRSKHRAEVVRAVGVR